MLDGKVKVEIGISESSLQGSQRKLPFSIKKSSVKGSGGKLIENNVFEIDSEKLRQHRSIQFEIVVNTKEVGIDPFDIAYDAGFNPNISFRNASSVYENKFTKFQRMACCAGVNPPVRHNLNTDDFKLYPSIDNTIIIQELYIPLRFWFCKEPGLALPLIALQYHEVNIIVDFAPALQHESPELWCDYIYLDTDERRRFAQVSHEYLIEQLQVNTFPVSLQTENYKLTFNHPVKELIWFVLPDTWNTIKSNNVYSFLTLGPTIGSVDPGAPPSPAENSQLTTLKLNGQERFAPRRIDYFTREQPYLYHTSRGLDRNDFAPFVYDDDNIRYNTVAVYSFALRPEEHQPSGTCNFSRIDSAILNITNGTTSDNQLMPPFVLTLNHPEQHNLNPSLKVYAINYNILRIMSGMGGLAYSN